MGSPFHGNLNWKFQMPNTGTSSTAGGTMRISRVVSDTVPRPMNLKRTIA